MELTICRHFAGRSSRVVWAAPTCGHRPILPSPDAAWQPVCGVSSRSIAWSAMGQPGSPVVSHKKTAPENGGRW